MNISINRLKSNFRTISLKSFSNICGYLLSKRLYGKFGQLSTVRDHMPDNHKLYVDQTPEAAIDWAESIGASTSDVIRYILDTYQT